MAYTTRKRKLKDIGENRENANKKYKKTPIKNKLRKVIWNMYIGKENNIGPCFCCRKQIRSTNFEAGHIIPESKGGELSVNNLRCICSVCNKSMGNKNMHEFKNNLIELKERIKKKYFENRHDVKIGIIERSYFLFKKLNKNKIKIKLRKIIDIINYYKIKKYQLNYGSDNAILIFFKNEYKKINNKVKFNNCNGYYEFDIYELVEFINLFNEYRHIELSD